jgi:hypothetical protein
VVVRIRLVSPLNRARGGQGVVAAGDAELLADEVGDDYSFAFDAVAGLA